MIMSPWSIQFRFSAAQGAAILPTRMYSKVESMQRTANHWQARCRPNRGSFLGWNRMKSSRCTTARVLIPVFIVTLTAIVGVVATFAQSKRNRAAKEFMREKLELSQRVLEGVATEDYDLIIAKGTRLSAMSQEADWRVFENPDYEQQSAIFRQHVNSLVKAAKDKNLDSATLAYVRVTMSCVDCHKVVRGKLVASADGSRATALTGRRRWIECGSRSATNGMQLPSMAQCAARQAAILSMAMNE
jgi:hypothetical protein